MQVFTTPGAADTRHHRRPATSTLAVGVRWCPASTAAARSPGYQYSTDGGATWRDRDTGTTASPILIVSRVRRSAHALANGQTYAVQLRAVNAAGAGAASETRSLAPRGVPDDACQRAACRRATVTRRHASTPATDGGSPITAYEYQLDDGAVGRRRIAEQSVHDSRPRQRHRVLGRLRAATPSDRGAASTALAATPRTVPGAPTGVVASQRLAPGHGHVGSRRPRTAAIGDHRLHRLAATSRPRAGRRSAAAPQRSLTCTVTGLTNGTTVYADVVAVNAAGTGASSDAALVADAARSPAGGDRLDHPRRHEPLGRRQRRRRRRRADHRLPVPARRWRLGAGSGRLPARSRSPASRPAVEYSVRIRAISAGGTGAASAAVLGVPHTTPRRPDGAGAPRARPHRPSCRGRHRPTPAAADHRLRRCSGRPPRTAPTRPSPTAPRRPPRPP